MGIKSKDIIILVIGLIGSFLLAFLSSPIKIDLIYGLYFIVGLVAFLILAIGWVIEVKNRELEDRLNEQETEQKKLGEKLKIYEQLDDIRIDIRELKKEK